MQNKIKVPNIENFLKDYEFIKNSFEDLKMIILNIPMDNLSLDNINKINDNLSIIKTSCKKYINCLRESENMYDFFENGSESRGFCRKINIDEQKLYEIKDTFLEISNFDVKQFIIENKK